MKNLSEKSLLSTTSTSMVTVSSLVGWHERRGWEQQPPHLSSRVQDGNTDRLRSSSPRGKVTGTTVFSGTQAAGEAMRLILDTNSRIGNTVLCLLTRKDGGYLQPQTLLC